MIRLAVSDTPVIWAMAVPMSASGSKYSLRRPTPAMDWDSMWVMPSTVVE